MNRAHLAEVLARAHAVDTDHAFTDRNWLLHQVTNLLARVRELEAALTREMAHARLDAALIRGAATSTAADLLIAKTEGSAAERKRIVAMLRKHALQYGWDMAISALRDELEAEKQS